MKEYQLRFKWAKDFPIEEELLQGTNKKQDNKAKVDPLVKVEVIKEVKLKKENKEIIDINF